MTDASVPDSQVVEESLTTDNTASGVWADSAYWWQEIEGKVKGLTNRIHRKGYRSRPLRDLEEAGQPASFPVSGTGRAYLWGACSGAPSGIDVLR